MRVKKGLIKNLYNRPIYKRGKQSDQNWRMQSGAPREHFLELFQQWKRWPLNRHTLHINAVPSLFTLLESFLHVAHFLLCDSQCPRTKRGGTQYQKPPLIIPLSVWVGEKLRTSSLKEPFITNGLTALHYISFALNLLLSHVFATVCPD